MQVPSHYSASTYHLPKEFIREITTLRPKKSTTALVLVWIELISLVWMGMYVVPESWFWIAYVPLVFLIAGRYGALLQLIHESAHNLLSYSKKQNLFLARWFCAYPVGVFLDGYIAGHMKHHAWTNTAQDPPSDTEKYRVVDFHDPRIYLLFLKDILGITALSIFFKYKEGDDATHEAHPETGSKLKALIQIACVQAFILTFIFHLDIHSYFLFWLFPAVSPHMFLMRIRGIAEHGLSKQLGYVVQKPFEGNFFTRSFMTRQNHYAFKPLIWLERILISSLNVNHHHEHHLFPVVPFYHLPALHEKVRTQAAQMNPEIYASGYFAAALYSLTHAHKPVLVEPCVS